MEIELKYSIKDKSIAEKLWADDYLASLEEEDSREKLCMKAAYFDTEDGVLAQNDIAFRVRMEGEKTIASLKWKGKSEGALHTREEINVPIDGEACLMMPSPAIFKESEVGIELIRLIGDKSLGSTMEVGFLRSRMRIDTGGSIMEISIDSGEIVTDYGCLPICEIEIELFSGNQADLVAVGEKLAAKYELEPELRSKYARGLSLLRQE